MKFKRLCSLILLPILLTGCFDNGVSDIGDAEMFNSGLVSDVTWLRVDSKFYIYCDACSDSALKEEKTFLASFNDEYHYSFKIYEFNAYPDILLVNAISKLNFVNAYWLYAYEYRDYIPGFLLDDFPHYDTPIWGGLEATINNKTYVSYGYSASDYRPGKKLPFTYDGHECYEVIDEEYWIAVDLYDEGSFYQFYYEQDKVTNLPVKIVTAGSSRIQYY